MNKAFRLIIGIPICFTMLVGWFAWSALHAAPPLAKENLRGAGLSISAAIEQLAVADPSFRSLARYTTADIAYFALIDRQGTVRFHTNPGLIGKPYPNKQQVPFTSGLSERRERLGTGEEVYLLGTKIHNGPDEYLLVLALHTYKADQVIRRAKTGVTVVAALTAALWGLTLVLFYLLRREETRRKEMLRREELARLGEMGAIMAHEMRNPLAGIKGFAQLVETAADLEQAGYHAGKIVDQCLRMEKLANDLLAFARDDKGARETTDLSKVVQDCVALLRMDIATRNIKIVVNAPSQMRACVVVDRIVQMLLNLMKNAVQAMPEGGVLAVSLLKDRHWITLRIKDDGAGIPPKDMPHIFTPFWTSKAQGTGLGLALCRKVAEEHGGQLSVASKVDSGTEFTVTLPV